MFNCTNIQLYNSSTDITRNGVGVFAKLAALEAASSGGPTLNVVSSDTTPAKITITNTHATQFDGSCALEFEMDHANHVLDYSYIFATDAYDLVMSRTQHPSSTNAKKEQIRLTGSGHVVLAGGTTANASSWDGGHPSGTIILGRCQLINELFFSPSFHSVPASASAAGDEGLFSVDETGIFYRTSTEWLKAPLLDYDWEPAEPLLLRNTVNENPGGYSNWNLMDDKLTAFVHDSTQMSRQRLPLNPVNGQEITLYIANSGGALNIHTGAPVIDGVYRTFHISSTGRASAYQCNVSPPNKYTCIFIESVQQWLLL